MRISERLSAARASPRQAAGLALSAGEPVLLIRRVAYTCHDAPVEYRVSCVDTTRHEYSSDLRKGVPPAVPARRRPEVKGGPARAVPSRSAPGPSRAAGPIQTARARPRGSRPATG
ncbi:MAG: UTRA domain-containing protein [Burkholderiales bacterium]|nr:UTRA domain-containing protein [Burkholderiales bacterium]